MSTLQAENKEIVRKYVEEGITGGNLAVIDEIIADDYIQHNSAGSEPFHGPDEVKENVTMLRTAFPDVECMVKDLIAEGDTVVRRDVATGTHKGEFMGIESTEQEIEVRGVHIHRLEDGQIVETWSQTDVMGALQQLGAVEPSGT